MSSPLLVATTPETGFYWKFGRPLSSLPPETAWAILTVIAAAGIGWIVFSYWRTLVRLSWRRRLLLCVVRATLLLCVLAALTGPTWTEREYVRRASRPFAVLVDQSQSMTKPDYRGQLRIDDALRRWHALAPIAERRHGALRTFEYASAVRERGNGTVELGTGQTRFFKALEDVLGRAPPGGWAGVVTLTDGIDTTGEDAAAASAVAAQKALAAGTPLYFVAGRNLGERKEEKPFVIWRDLVVPAQTPPRSNFTVELTVESYQPTPRSVPVRIRTGSRWRTATPLFLNAGRRAVLWRTEVHAEEPGPMELEVQAGDGADALVARTVVNVQDPHATRRVLLAQFTPDWGQRFLADSLSRDPQFEVSTRTAIRRREGVDFPRNAAGMLDWDVIVLFGVSGSSLSAEQQTALGEWVRNGGVFVLVAPEVRVSGLAGTELERILPVTFSSTVARSAGKNEAQEMPKAGTFAAARGTPLPHGQHVMKGAAAPRRTIEILPSDYRTALVQIAAPELFEVTWGTLARQLFAGSSVPFPIVSSYVAGLRPKPGADVLATHPTADGPDGRRAVLFASQRHGAGSTAVLATDSLWRWKLIKPSNANDYDRFWGQVLLWLTRHQAGTVKIDHAPLYAEPGKPLQVRVTGAQPDLVFARVSVDGRGERLLKRGEGTKDFATFEWTPDSEGLWHVEARTAGGAETHQWVTVRAAVVDRPVEIPGELSGRPTDEAVLASLAQATGGALLEHTAPAAWTTGQKEHTEVVAVREMALWHQWQFLMMMLLLYAADLVLRRFSRLL